MLYIVALHLIGFDDIFFFYFFKSKFYNESNNLKKRVRKVL